MMGFLTLSLGVYAGEHPSWTGDKLHVREQAPLETGFVVMLITIEFVALVAILLVSNRVSRLSSRRR